MPPPPLLPITQPRALTHLISRFLPRPRLQQQQHYYATKPLPPRPKIVETDITEAFLKGSGPGGQKINKTSSAVQLKHLPTGLVVKCQETRSRTQNRKIARRILAERVEDLELGAQSRSAVKVGVAQRKKASRDKKARRKYRRLAEGDEAVGDEDDGVVTENVEESHGGLDVRQTTDRNQGLEGAPDAPVETTHLEQQNHHSKHEKDRGRE